MGLPHSFCRIACSAAGGGGLADELDMSETLDACDVVVLDRDRPLAGEAVEPLLTLLRSEGSGTESIIV